MFRYLLVLCYFSLTAAQLPVLFRPPAAAAQQPFFGQQSARLVQLPSGGGQQLSQFGGGQQLSQFGGSAVHQPAATTVSNIQTFGRTVPLSQAGAASNFLGAASSPLIGGGVGAHAGGQQPQTVRRVVTIRQQPLFYLMQGAAQSAASAAAAAQAQQNARRAHLHALSEVLREYEPTVLID